MVKTSKLDLFCCRIGPNPEFIMSIYLSNYFSKRKHTFDKMVAYLFVCMYVCLYWRLLRLKFSFSRETWTQTHTTDIKKRSRYNLGYKIKKLN